MRSRGARGRGPQPSLDAATAVANQVGSHSSTTALPGTIVGDRGQTLIPDDHKDARASSARVGVTVECLWRRPVGCQLQSCGVGCPRDDH